MEIKDFITEFAEIIEVENADSLTPETEFHQLDEWSSISIMVLIAYFDEKFDKELTNADIRQAITIKDLYNFAIS